MIHFADPDGFAEFGVTTNFSFLRGASHPEELVAQAIVLKLGAIGIADRNSLAGIVRAHMFLRHNKDTAGDLRVLSGARLVFCDGTPDILAYPRDRAAYGRLCRLLTQGNIRAQKGTCRLALDDLLQWHDGLQLIALPASTFEPDEGAFAGRTFEEFNHPDARLDGSSNVVQLAAVPTRASLLPPAGEDGPTKSDRMRDVAVAPFLIQQAESPSSDPR